MLTIKTNISEVVAQYQVMVDKIKNPDKMLRTMATTLTGVIAARVFTDGKASDDQQIGTYSNDYMKVRTGNFGNSGKVTRGNNKGNLKDSGTISRGVKKGQPRPKYNRTADTKVVASLTRQMENDFGTNAEDPAQTEAGYGIGFKNPHNYDKSQWVEATYKKPIWQLTQEEQNLVQQIADKFTTDAITGQNS